jgi:DMSO/TMAO reductase YedYZ molybdopterin-dependent catalytic subunit
VTSRISPAPEEARPGALRERIPPGQVVTTKFPVLHYGAVPAIDIANWDLQVFGLVREPLRFTYDQILAMPRERVVADVHCVTGWSKLDTEWEGVKFRELMRHVEPLPEARFVEVRAEAGFTTSLPLEVLMDDDVIMAYIYDGAPLTPEHGAPLRLVVPKKYFWKSAKWIRGFEFMAHDRLGFWERNGYNNSADPWKEERYA